MYFGEYTLRTGSAGKNERKQKTEMKLCSMTNE